MEWNGGNVRLELIMDNPHDRRVEGHADPQEGEAIAQVLQVLAEIFDGLGVAAEHHLVWGIDVANMDILPAKQHLPQQIHGGVRGCHGAGVQVSGGGLVHAEGPLIHNSKPVLRGIDAGQAQRGQLAQTVAGHSRRMDTKRDEVSSHGVFQGEQGRLLPPGLLKVLLPILE